MSFPKVLSNGGDWCIIYAVNKEGPQPIHGAYWTKEEWMITAWDREGYRHSPDCPSQLDISKAVKDGLVQDQSEGPEESSGAV